ncbi:MAG TPA: FAD-dependent monooxygenase [Usitatibacter sp.]|nr:FAD-dependent monooxygenase [Usitatibacter sp.]
MTTPVLIAGAGPTGLALALWLQRLGVPFRIVDRNAGPARESRALAVQARTLELYQQVGFVDEAMSQGLRMEAVNLWARGAKVAHVEFGELGGGISPFPYAMILAQDDHERLLVEHLAKRGVNVERDTRLAGFEAQGGRVIARLERTDGSTESCECEWLAGCDGAHSVVRETLGLGFPGGTYQRVFYVADVEAKGPVVNGELNVALDESDLLAVFPLADRKRVRFVGTLKPRAGEVPREIQWEDVSRTILDRLRIEVTHVNWLSTYHVHHRVASRFRIGRAFLLGDAAHIHSPVGGQGMNTGIGDAVNLAWKLADVVKGRAAASLLDTYEPERIAFARRLVATTDRAFTFVSSDGGLARFVRLEVIPRLLPRLFSFRAARRYFFRTISQTLIHYPESALSAGKAGEVRGGDRLPWTGANFAPLASVQWQVHVYGTAPAPLTDACRELGLELHAFPWDEKARAAGLARDALYLVRPDGYVALADAAASADALRSYLVERGLHASPARA